MQVIDIPLTMRHNVVDVWGADGEGWLAHLPSLVQELADAWGLQIHGPAGPLSFHYVVEATRKDGSPAVLKIGPTGPGHLAIEAAALDAYAGHGAVRLLAYDPQRGALLLEQAISGTSAAALVPGDDAAATAAIIGVTRRLHHPPASHCPLPDLTTQGKAFADHLRAGRGTDVLPRHWVQQAAGLFGELCASSPDKVVLHGDLHHDNVLKASREPWLAIDPHGVVGDPGYETGALLYNPWPERREAELLALVPARIEQLAAGLTIPVERVVAWGFVKAVLSSVWTYQSGTMPDTRPLTSPDCSGPVSPETRTTSQLSRNAELRRLLNLSLASALIKHVRCSSRLAHRPDRGTTTGAQRQVRRHPASASARDPLATLQSVTSRGSSEGDVCFAAN